LDPRNRRGRKRYLIQVAGRNLGIIMRKIFGVGTPRGLAGAVFLALCALQVAWERVRAEIALVVRLSAPCEQPVGALG
jgi:hypothetical protein